MLSLSEMKKANQLQNIALALLISLIMYVGAYGLTRVSGILVHHTNVFIFETTGQSHAVFAGSPSGLSGKVAERVFYPLRLMEAKYWNARSN